MDKELTPYDEAYYIVDKHTSVLLQKAGFDLPCIYCFRNNDLYVSTVGGYLDESIYEKNSNYSSNNGYWSSAPLIDIALYYITKKDYLCQITTEHIRIFANISTERKLISIVPTTQADSNRDINLMFIQVCCHDIIENKKTNNDNNQ